MTRLSKFAVGVVSLGAALAQGSANCAGVQPWSPTQVYSTAGMKVTANNPIALYQSEWWNQGSDPAYPGGPWQYLGACSGGSSSGGGGGGSPCAAEWSSRTQYQVVGTHVGHNGVNWVNAWWSQGNEPGTPGGPEWTAIGACSGGSPQPNPQPTQAPYYPTQAPYYPTQAPYYPTQAPYYPTQAPYYPTQAPYYPTQAPYYPTQAPNPYPTQAPNPYPTQAPNPYPTQPPNPNPNPNPSPSGAVRSQYVYMDWQPVDWTDGCKTVDAMADLGINNVMAGFWVSPDTGLADFAQIWSDTPSTCKQASVGKLQSMGGRGVILSCGGATGGLCTQWDATSYAQKACAAATKGDFQGIDFDLENFAPGSGSEYVKWLVTASKAAKQCVGWVSHAPQHPYFGDNGFGDFYGKVADQAAGSIDAMLIQYYNQGNNADDYNALFKSFSGASIGELQKAHPGSKNVFVIGKPAQADDASNGFVDKNSLSSAICKGEQQDGYTGGVMFWMCHNGQDSAGMFSTMSKKC